MVRPWRFLVPIFFISCKSLPDQRRASLQFMQVATEPKATRLAASQDNNRLMSALARVDSDQSCTGVLIGKAVTGESPAYLLTAGHCLMDFEDVSSSNRIFQDALPRSDRNSIHFPAADFRIGRVVYATMKGVDLAVAEMTTEENRASIFRLTERRELEAEDAKLPKPVTLQHLKSIGIEPIRWASQLPAFGEGIRIISVATEEDGDAPFLREHRCLHEGVADVVENIWHWYDLARNNCEDIHPGSSGAPVLNAQSSLFAIVNTSSRNALSQDCYMGQPCEMTEQNFQVAAARNYGSTVLELPACFNDQGFFSTTEPRCPLERSASGLVTGQTKTPWNPEVMKPDERRWNVRLQPADADSSGYRFKTGRLPASDCRVATGYSERIPWSNPRLMTLPLPVGAGLHALCWIAEEKFQKHDLHHAAMIVMNIDGLPPRLKPRPVLNPLTQKPLMAVRKSCQNLAAGATLEQRKQCAVAVLTLELQPNEIVDFYHGWIDSKAPDCRLIKDAGYGVQAHVPVTALPARLCVWAIDGAGNRAQEPGLIPVRAPTHREIMEATDVLVDWSFRRPQGFNVMMPW
ncbi:MAG TPA: trypsin-like peptidase domain-containing protein [Oligoflexus sp.]|uniref:trypsin-like peptidase domain-containing protein n=1 Tax=Oligoflexus sp. TaxID=1971216 RepID=UPI002D2D7933|nr:trypsin-like peptidase domain-containing protein [Oligoflexus sp.]HYX32057.1 trypsin-like peptidase domain-containing protein [Oligoflexus sp.]